MLAAHKSLFALTADEIMTRNVIAIPQAMNLHAAARLLAQERISGAPVTDGQGRCVGVLSATDFVRWARTGGRPDPVLCTGSPCVCSDWQLVDLERLPCEEVRSYMTRNPVVAEPTTPLTRLARLMRDAHIHRVIVVDGDGRPVGIVSSTDVLGALASHDQQDPQDGW